MTAVRERPILFSGPMVRAILGGRKTMTRRVIEPRSCLAHSGIVKVVNIGGANWERVTSRNSYATRCPYGEAGDHLWVRETFGYGHANAPHSIAHFVYRADGEPFVEPGFWKPSIHMPRSASRIDLEVTEIRAERLQDMTMGDMDLEGTPWEPTNRLDGDKSRLEWFRSLWDKLNARRGHSWESNPWVWVVSFKRIGATP